MGDFVAAHLGGGYGSELEEEARAANSTGEKREGSLAFKKPAPVTKAFLGGLVDAEHRKSYASTQRMNAYDRHKKFINDYVLRYKHSIQDYLPNTANHRTDHDVLRDNHRFIRDDDEDNSNWETRMAVKYYNRLFKEYCLADMSRYKEGKVGLRWRTQSEVFAGKGQFLCGNKKCAEKENLKSYEVNFAYVEAGEKKNALVKLRVCPDCADKLNYKSIKKEKKEKKKKRRKLEGEFRGVSEEGENRKEEEGGNKKEEGENKKEEENKKEGEKNEEERSKDPKTRQVSSTSAEAEAWKQKPTLDKSKDEEFDEYFDGMFL